MSAACGGYWRYTSVHYYYIIFHLRVLQRLLNLHQGKRVFLVFVLCFFYHYTDVRRHVIVKYFPEFCDKIHKHITLMIFSSDGGARDVLSETESSG